MNNSKGLEKGYIINIMFCVLMIMASVFFISSNDIFASLGLSEYRILGKYITKGTASLLFVICGLVNLLYARKSCAWKNAKYMILMCIGLFFAMLGDIFLIEFFIVGALLFAVGHVFFLIAFFFVSKFNIRDLVVMVCIFVPALLLILLYPHFNFEGMQALVIVYALIISVMLGKAISNVFARENRFINMLIALGALLFFLSDVMLLFNVFGGAPYVLDVLCIALYYPAEFLLAFSILIVGYKYNKQEQINAQ